MANISTAESNTLLSGTSGKDKFIVGDDTHHVENITVSGGGGKDTVLLQNVAKALVSAGDDNDSILASGQSTGSTINTGAGSDTVTVFSTDTTTIVLGGGANVINVYADSDYVITADNGADFKFNYANGATVGHATIKGSGGATLRGTNGIDTFVVTGDNTIVGCGGEDNIQFAGTASADGNDVIVSGSSGKLTIKDGAAHKLTLNGTATSLGAYSTYTPAEVIQKFMASLDTTTLKGTAALDEAILALNVKKFGSMQDVIDSAVSDCKTVKDADAFLRDYCGIILDNQDTGALTGWDASGSNVKTAKSIVPESSSSFGNVAAGSTFTADGLTVKVPENLASGLQTSIASGLKQWWVESGLDLIKSTYGSNYSFSTTGAATAKEMNLKFESAPRNKTLAYVTSTANSEGKTESLTLTVNTGYYNNILDENGASTINGASYLDRTIAHELTHAVMAANINNFSALPAYLKEGMAELTHGIDDERASVLTSLGGNSSKLKSALGNKTTDSGETTYAGGYILLRYLAQQAANSERANGMHVNAKETAVSLTATASDTLSTVTSDDYASTTVTIDASMSQKALYMIGNDKDNVMTSAATGSTLDGGKGNDKLYGNDGADVFVYEVGAGKDVIGNTGKNQSHTLFDESDKIIIVGAAESVTASGFMSFKDSKNTTQITFLGTSTPLTVNKVSSDTPVAIELRSSEGSSLKSVAHGDIPDGVELDSKTTTASLTSAANGTTVKAAEINSQIKMIDATKASNVYVVGNSQATTVSLNGGTVTGGYDYAKSKGLDDKFYGTDGAKDVFVYSLGGGKDQIYNYNVDDSDTIVIQGLPDSVTAIGSSGGDFSYVDNGKAVVLTLNEGKTKGSLTINNPVGKGAVYKEGNLTTPILTFGVDMPEYTSYGKKNASVIIANNDSVSTTAAAKTLDIDLAADGYSKKVKEVNAADFDGKVNLIGNGNANVLRASKGGSTLDGSAVNKATGDKLFGNAGVDTFVYRMIDSIGGGTDIIGGESNNSLGNYESQDRIVIMSGTGLVESDITVTDGKNNVTTLTLGKKDKLTINKASSDTTLSVYLAAEDANLATLTTPTFTYGSIPSGAGYATKNNKIDYTALTIGAATAGSTIDTTRINSMIKNIDMRSSTSVYVLGNAAANNISLGAAGGTVDGGAGNDKLYGGSGADVFYYKLGDGNDEMNYVDGNEDTIVIDGYSGSIDVGNSSTFKDSGSAITVNLKNDSGSGKLTLKNSTGKILIKDTAGNTLLNYRENIPDTENITFVKNIMSIGGGASLGSVTSLKASDYGINVKGIDASAYSTTALCLIAGDVKNTSYELTAGAAGSTLQGGAGTDKMYGGSGADVFVYSVGGGNDVINSLKGGDGDYIVLLGRSDAIDVTDAKVFKDSGKDITLTLNNQKLSIKNPDGQLKIVSGTQNSVTGAITLGDTLLSYGADLETGVEYQSGKTVLAVTADATVSSLALDISDPQKYYSKLKTVNASAYGGILNVTGNGLANELRAGSGSSTLNGGAGNDNLYGNSSGADMFVFDMSAELKNGKDVVRNYNQSNGDVISLQNVDASSVKATYNGKTLILTAASSADSQKTGTVTVNGTTDNFKTYANIDSTTKVAISINGESHTYQFLSNTKAKLLTAAVADGEATRDAQSSQFSSEVDDYWFTQPMGADIDSIDELSDIMEINPIAESSKVDDLSELLNRSDQLPAPSSLLKGASRNGARNK